KILIIVLDPASTSFRTIKLLSYFLLLLLKLLFIRRLFVNPKCVESPQFFAPCWHSHVNQQTEAAWPFDRFIEFALVIGGHEEQDSALIIQLRQFGKHARGQKL